MTSPQEIHFSLFVFFPLSPGKQFQTVLTPPLQLGIFSLGPPVGRKKKQDFNVKLTLLMNKTTQTFKTAQKTF